MCSLFPPERPEFTVDELRALWEYEHSQHLEQVREKTRRQEKEDEERARRRAAMTPEEEREESRRREEWRPAGIYVGTHDWLRDSGPG